MTRWDVFNAGSAPTRQHGLARLVFLRRAVAAEEALARMFAVMVAHADLKLDALNRRFGWVDPDELGRWEDDGGSVDGG